MAVQEKDCDRQAEEKEINPVPVFWKTGHQISQFVDNQRKN
jgi:hypothetical protein